VSIEDLNLISELQKESVRFELRLRSSGVFIGGMSSNTVGKYIGISHIMNQRLISPDFLNTNCWWRPIAAAISR